MQGNRISILIIGATGSLGSLITKHCLTKKNVEVNVLVRNPSKQQTLCDQVIENGGKIIIGDVTNHQSLNGVTKGIHTVISALIGNDDIVLEGQKALLQDGIQNGLSRFVPSDFSADYRKMSLDEHPFLAQRIRFREILQGTNVKGIHIFNGCFMETFWSIFLQKQHSQEALELECWGSDETLIDLTTYEDTAKFVAGVISDPEASGDFNIIGETLNYKQVAQIYTNVRGKPAHPKVMGSVQQLLEYRDQLKTQLPENFRKYIMTAYAVPMFDGRGKLFNPTHEKYGIKTVGVEEFLKANPQY